MCGFVSTIFAMGVVNEVGRKNCSNKPTHHLKVLVSLMVKLSSDIVKRQKVFTKDDLVKTKFIFKLTFLVAFMAILSLVYIWSRVQIVQYGYEINQLKQKQHQLLEQNQRLKLEVATMKSPSRIENLAKVQLKMVFPTKEQIRFVSLRGR